MKNLLIGSLAIVTSLGAVAQTPTSGDNSSQNKTDRSSAAITPMAQSNASADLAVTRAIRRALVSDSDLSMYAHNIKIITTTDHTVYLRGAIAAKDNMDSIVRIAKRHASGYPIMNQLTVSNS